MITISGVREEGIPGSDINSFFINTNLGIYIGLDNGTFFLSIVLTQKKKFDIL